MADIKMDNIEVTDRAIFKVIALVVMTLVYGVSFYLLQFVWWFGAYSLYGLIFSGVLVLLWELIKRRHFWMVWLPMATIIVGGMFLFADVSWISSALGFLYWVVSYVTCVLQIFAQSRSAYRRWEREMASEVGAEPIHDPVKDEFLEKLFSDDQKNGAS